MLKYMTLGQVGMALVGKYSDGFARLDQELQQAGEGQETKSQLKGEEKQEA